MANNYRQFSEAIQGITPDEERWLKAVLQQYEETAQSPEQAAFLKEVGAEFENLEHFPNFGWRFDRDGGNTALWLYSEECGDVEELSQVVGAFLKKFRPHACFALTWADWCSKLRVGEFSGGGVFITAKEILYMEAQDWARTLTEKFKEQKGEKKA